MAAEIERTVGIGAELVSGARGEFSVRVDGQIVAQKAGGELPSPIDCVERVREALQGPL